jgi:hypothetical protein
MTEPIRISLAHENPAYAGVVSFDGAVAEAIGFADTVGQRLPIKPSDEERIALQGLADAVQSAAGVAV